MTIHEVRTQLTPAEVIERGKAFFTLAGSPYAAFVAEADEGFLRLQLEVGHIVVAALSKDGATWVRGSASRGADLLSSFLSSLAAPVDVRQTTRRRGLDRTEAILTETIPARIPATPITPLEIPVRPAAQAA